MPCEYRPENVQGDRGMTIADQTQWHFQNTHEKQLLAESSIEAAKTLKNRT